MPVPVERSSVPGTWLSIELERLDFWVVAHEGLTNEMNSSAGIL
jgi:hypothetical protein